MKNIDISNCETEPIRFPGAIQPHGALLVLQAASGIIEAASESCEALFGISAESMLGQPIGLYFGSTAEASILTSAHEGRDELIHLSLNGKELITRPLLNSAGQILGDIEVSSSNFNLEREMLYQSRRDIAALRCLSDVVEITQQAAVFIREITHFDRVMFYRFDKDWNGEVIAEACVDNIEPYLGLIFPASDIPKQARELFKYSKARQIPDALYKPSPLIALKGTPPVDLGMSVLRSVSPLHIEYMSNMQVRATLVCPLIVEGRLWGLLSCQLKNEPKYFGYGERDTLGWFCEDISAHIEATLVQQKRERENRLTLLRRTLIDTVENTDISVLMHQGMDSELLKALNADGFAYLVGDEVKTCGITPDKEQIIELLKCRHKLGSDPFQFASNSLSSDFGLGADDDVVAGALFVSVQHVPAVTMIWFRLERQRTLRWGGDPKNAHLTDENGRLSPRKSFAQFIENVRGKSLDWSPEEMESALELGSIIEIEERRKEQQLAQTIFDSSPQSIAVLDGLGNIKSVNSSWKKFAQENSVATPGENSIGFNYHEICNAAVGKKHGAEAADAWRGIEAVISRKIDHFSLEYLCDSPSERRFFCMNVYPIIGSGKGVVVEHENISERVQAGLALKLVSEKNLMFLRNSSDGLHILDLAGNVIEASNSFCTLLGYRYDEVIGMNVAQWDALFDVPKLRQLITEHILNREPFQFETLHRRKNGTTFEVEISGNPVEFNGQSVMYYSSRDISARMQAERALQESEQRYRFLFDNTPMPMWVFEEGSLRFLEVNNRAVEHYGYSRDEFLNMSLLDISPVEDIPGTIQSVSNAVDGKVTGERLHLKRDGTEIKVFINTMPMMYGEKPARIVLINDITERVRAEEARHQEAKRFRSFFEKNSSVMLFIEPSSGTIINANAAAANYYGYSVEQMIGMNISAINILSVELIAEERQKALKENRSHFNFSHRLASGEIRNVEVYSTPIESDNGLLLFSIVHDITDRKLAEVRLEQERLHLHTLLKSIPDMVWLKNLEGVYLSCNPEFERFFGASEADIIGKTDYDFVSKDMADLFRHNDMEASLAKAPRVNEEWITYANDGHKALLETSKTPMFDSHGTVIGVLGIGHNITKRHNMEEEVRQLAFYDALTKLPNRRLLIERLSQALTSSKRTGCFGALMFLDLDNFKPLNDAHGHVVGDLLLKEVSGRLLGCVREIDTVARFGGDEFVIMISDLYRNKAASSVEAGIIAEKIRAKLSEPYLLVFTREGQSNVIVKHICTASIGVNVFIHGDGSVDEIMDRADSAMYRAKENGRNLIRFHEVDSKG